MIHYLNTHLTDAQCLALLLFAWLILFAVYINATIYAAGRLGRRLKACREQQTKAIPPMVCADGEETLKVIRFWLGR